MTFKERTEVAGEIKTVVEFLSQAKANDFISGSEARGIFTELLKETGYKKPAFRPEAALKKEEKK